jgi:VanZ family protein
MTLDQRHIRVYRILLIVLFGAISYLAFTPLKIPVVERTWDKMDHAIAFFALAFATDFSFPGVRYGLGKILPLLAYGVMIEVIQHHLPYRHFDLFDVVADMVGLSLYAASLPLVRRLPLLNRRWF